MFKYLTAILILVSILSGYAAEAFEQVDHCSSHSSEQLSFENSASSENDKTNTHCNTGCLLNHCHSSHYATLKQFPTIRIETYKASHGQNRSNLFPADFTFDLFRPPISA